MLAHRHTKHYWPIMNVLADFVFPNALIFYGGILVGFVVVTWIAVYLVIENPVLATSQLQSSELAIQELLTEYPKITCMVSTNRYKFILFIPMMILMIWGAGIAGLIATMLYVLKTNPKAYMSTLKMQWTLFRSLVAQLGATLIFMYFPLLFWLIAGYVNSNYSILVAIVCMCLLAMHSSIDCIVILIYVKPFRRAIQRIFNRSLQDTMMSDPTKTQLTPVQLKSRSGSIFVFPVNLRFRSSSLQPLNAKY